MERRAPTSSSKPAIKRSATNAGTTLKHSTSVRTADPLRSKPSTSSKQHQAGPAPPPKISRSNTTTAGASSNAQIQIVLPPNAKPTQPGGHTRVMYTSNAPSSSKTHALTRPPVAAVASTSIKRSNTTPTQRVTGWTPIAGVKDGNIRAPSPNKFTLTRNAAPVITPRAPEPTAGHIKGHLGRSKSESHRPNANETAPIYDVFKGLNNGKKGLVLPTIVPGVTTKNGVIAADENTAIIDSGLPGVKSGHVVKVVESGGVCLQAALKALYGRHLPPAERITWHRTTEQDKRMEMLLNWIEKTRWGLASLGFHKFLATKSRGALIFNVHGRLASSPQEPAVDWITFEEAQKTLDSQMQEYIATYDPGMHTLVFAFRLSPNEQSLKIWGKKIGVPPTLPQTYGDDIDRIKKEMRKKKWNIVTEDSSSLKPTSFMKWFKSKK